MSGHRPPITRAEFERIVDTTYKAMADANIKRRMTRDQVSRDLASRFEAIIEDAPDGDADMSSATVRRSNTGGSQ